MDFSSLMARSMAASAGTRSAASASDQHCAHEPHHAASACPAALVSPSPPSRTGSCACLSARSHAARRSQPRSASDRPAA